MTTDFFGWMISRWYIQDYFPETSLQLMEELVQELKDTYYDILGNASWLGNSVAKVAIEKV